MTHQNLKSKGGMGESCALSVFCVSFWQNALSPQSATSPILNRGMGEVAPSVHFALVFSKMC